MATIQHSVHTNAGLLTVEATEPVPGLRVFQVPDNVSPNSPYRWVLAHHGGPALASFETQESATEAAGQAGTLVDWTRNSMTVANLLGPTGMNDLMELLRAADGQHPNA
ncbi:hypothetical protein [Streptomyces zaomyceticus]|uniref:hypothetical protein n=1 Tax=Streptomyces zaomyceticus TaxID=68286 RepID=UPI00368A7400